MHAKKRIDAQPGLKLPLNSLLDILSSSETDHFTRSATLIWLRRALSRASSEQQFDNVSILKVPRAFRCGVCSI